jgi:hypothetical protein
MVAPRYGSKSDGVRRRCTAHKLPTDIKWESGRMCQHEGCNKRATFGDSRLSSQLDQFLLLKWCKDHMDPRYDVNISAIRCLERGCSKQASFGSKHGYAKWCKKHRKDGEHVNVLVRYCTVDGCSKRATWSPKNQRLVERCKDHRLPTDVCRKYGKKFRMAKEGEGEDEE